MGKFSAETVWLPHWLYAGASAMAPTTHRSAYSCPCRAARLLYNAHDVCTHHPHEAPIALFYFYSTLVRRGSSAEQCVYLANSIYPRPFHRRPGVASRDPLAIFTSSSSPAAACQFADYYRITLILFSSLSLSLFRFIPLSPPASPAFPLYAENARRQQRQ